MSLLTKPISLLYESSFRDEIRKLKEVFYKPVFSQNFPPIFIALTATMSKSNLKQLLHLTTIYFPDKSKLWGGPEAVKQHNITLSQHCGSEYNAQLDLLASYLLPLLIIDCSLPLKRNSIKKRLMLTSFIYFPSALVPEFVREPDAFLIELAFWHTSFYFRVYFSNYSCVPTIEKNTIPQLQHTHQSTHVQ